MGQFSASPYPPPKGSGTASPPVSSVLVVDDEAALRRTLRASLATSGFAVEHIRLSRDWLFNVGSEPITFTLPAATLAPGWEVVIDTTQPSGCAPAGVSLQPRAEVKVASRAITVLRSKG